MSVDLDPGDHLVAEGKTQGLAGAIFPVQADLTSRAGADEMVAAVHARFGAIDVLINNAGGGARLGPVEELDDETRRWNSAINIDGMINCTLAAGADIWHAGPATSSTSRPTPRSRGRPR